MRHIKTGKKKGVQAAKGCHSAKKSEVRGEVKDLRQIPNGPGQVMKKPPTKCSEKRNTPRGKNESYLGDAEIKKKE